MTDAREQPTPEWAAPHVWEVDDARVPRGVREYAARLHPSATRVIRVSDQEYVFYTADGELLDSLDLGSSDLAGGAVAQDPGEALAAHPRLKMLRIAMIAFAVFSLLAVMVISIVEGLN